MAYLAQFRERRGEVWRRERPPQGYPTTVATTWTMAVARLRAEEPAAVDLLNLCAFLAPEAIPCHLFTGHADALSPPLDGAVADPLRWSDLTVALRGYSLVEVVDDTLTVHRLVQAATRDGLTEEERRRWAGAAVALLNAGFPYDEDDPVTWTASRELVGHALTVADHAESSSSNNETTSLLFGSVGSYLNMHAEFGQAKACAERALRIAEATFGPDHTRVADVLNALGYILFNQDGLSEAKACFERSLRIREVILGSEDLSVANSLSNLSCVFLKQSDLIAVKAFIERVLKIKEAARGPEHPYVAIRLYILGDVLWKQEDHKNAQACLERARAILEVAYPSEHPTFIAAAVYHLLGLVLEDQGSLLEAKTSLQRSLTVIEKIFPLDHLNTTIIKNDLERLHNST